MNPIDFLQSLMKMEETIRKMQNDPQKQEILFNVMSALVNIMNHVIMYSDSKDNFIVNFIGKQKGKESVSVNLSIIEDFSEQEYGDMVRSLATVLNKMSEHHNQLRNEKAGAVLPEKKEAPKDCATAEISKQEDGSINIKFN